MNDCILAIDQSTQGTKAVVFGPDGRILSQHALGHKQLIDANGWVEHDLDEIWENTLSAARMAVDECGTNRIAGVAICNQRETAAAWHRDTGKPIHNAIVWQCARAASLCEELRAAGHAALIEETTGMALSPLYTAAKLAWLLRNVPEAARLAGEGQLCLGTIDSYLLYRLSGGRFATDPSNASRTQLMRLDDLAWDEKLLSIYGIPRACLPGILPSDSLFGHTDLGGTLPKPVPIHAMLGDSQAALFGHRCIRPGSIKVSYGTGSSILLNAGEKPFRAGAGLTASVAWAMGGKVNYVLEGNISYSGAVVRWLEEIGLIQNAAETETLARAANPLDTTYLVPAFTGLGAPWFDEDAKAVFTGMTRLTGRAELVRAGLESIAYQISDVLGAIGSGYPEPLAGLRADGGATQNAYLMQFQSDITGLPLTVARTDAMSAFGAALCAGIALGIYDASLDPFDKRAYASSMPQARREEKLRGWRHAVGAAVAKNDGKPPAARFLKKAGQKL